MLNKEKTFRDSLQERIRVINSRKQWRSSLPTKEDSDNLQEEKRLQKWLALPEMSVETMITGQSASYRKKISTKKGTFFSVCFPSMDVFWEAWKLWKPELKAGGMSVYKGKDGEWNIAIWLKIRGN